MNNTTHTIGNTLVAFHTGRGGQFYNAGYKTFIGQDKSINDYTYDLFISYENINDVTYSIGERTNLLELLDDAISNESQVAIDRLAKYGLDLGKKVFVNASGNEVGLPIDNDGAGTIDIDGGYDTTHVCRLEDCSDSEMEIIIRDCGSKKYESPYYRGFASDEVIEYCAEVLGLSVA